jgi:hypothetical protein
MASFVDNIPGKRRREWVVTRSFFWRNLGIKKDSVLWSVSFMKPLQMSF